MERRRLLKSNVRGTGDSYLTVDLNSQWVTSAKTITGYQVYMSNSNYNVNNGYACMKVSFKGIPDLKVYINSYAESSYDYTISFKLDAAQPTSLPAYNNTNALANTRSKQYNPATYTDPTNTTYWSTVDYSNDGEEHFFWIVYRKDSSTHTNDDRGYLAIPLTYTYSNLNIAVLDSYIYANQSSANIRYAYTQYSYMGGTLVSKQRITGTALSDSFGSNTTEVDREVEISYSINGLSASIKAILGTKKITPVYYSYLLSSGTQYIDTGVVPTLTTKMVFKHMPLEYTGACTYGCKNNSDTDSDNVDFRYFDYSDGGSMFDCSTGRTGNTSSSKVTLGNIYEITCANGSLTITGVGNTMSYSGTSTASTGSLTSDTIKLFGGNYEDNTMTCVSARCYCFQIYQDDVLVRDMVPCTCNGIKGMWDKVNSNFYPNSGTGDFILGSTQKMASITENANLLAFYDAINNAGTSHNASATTWIPYGKISSDYTLTITGATINDKYITYGGTTYKEWNSANGSQFNLGTGDFTIISFSEFSSFDYPHAGYNIIGQTWYTGSTSNYRWHISVESSGQLSFNLYVDSAWVTYLKSSSTLSLNTLYCCVIMQRSGTIYAYIDNVLQCSTAHSTSLNNSNPKIAMDLFYNNSEKRYGTLIFNTSFDEDTLFDMCDTLQNYYSDSIETLMEDED